MKRMPSFDTLRAFEAAARHCSFTRAAAELHVTQSAMSHRVKALEDELGVKLFHRTARGMQLSQQGEALAAGVRRGVAEFASAIAALDRQRRGAAMRVSVLPSFAVRWLVPRLTHFRTRHPDIEVRIAAEPGQVDLKRGEADLAVRFGLGRYPELNVVPLMGDAVMPVCSPQFLGAFGPVHAPKDLLRVPRIYDSVAEGDESGSGWRVWFAHFGIADNDAGEGVRFNQAALALDAAANGLGVALGRRSLVADDVSHGKLVRVLPIALPTAYSYFMVSTPEAAERASSVAFRGWLLDEAARMRRRFAAIEGGGDKEAQRRSAE